MKVFVAGATGVLGARLVPLLVAQGHEVHGVARGTDKAAWLRERGAEPVSVDLFDAEDVHRVVGDLAPDAVVHVATAVPPMTKAGRMKSWETHNRLRSEVTPVLADAAIAAGATVFVKDSVCFFYVDGGERLLDEDAPLLDSRFADPSLEGERAAVSFTSEADGRRGVALRFGYFYGANTTGLDEALRLARLGLSPLVGRRTDHWPMLHLDDAAAAALAAIDHDVSGAFNIADASVTKGENLAAFAGAFSLRRTPRPIPTWTMKPVSGSAVPVLGASRRISSERFINATGWTPQYPTPAEGWPAVATAEHSAEPHTEVPS